MRLGASPVAACWTWATLAFAATAALVVAQAATRAPFLEDVTSTEDGDTGALELRFTAPAKFMHHFPPAEGAILRVVLQYSTADQHPAPVWQEKKIIPARGRMPRLVVRVTDDTGCDDIVRPVCLYLEFEQPVHYRVHGGGDGRSLLLDLALPEKD